LSEKEQSIRIGSGFGGLGVCVLASGTQDCGFVPDRSRRIFHNGKIHGTQSLVESQTKVHDTEKTTPKKKKKKAVTFLIMEKSTARSPSSKYQNNTRLTTYTTRTKKKQRGCQLTQPLEGKVVVYGKL
jgi:hypothetical protein